MTFDDIKKTLIQAIAVGSIIEVHGGEDRSGFSADTYAFGAPTAFRVNREWLIICFQNGEARFPAGGVTSITEKHRGEWAE